MKLKYIPSPFFFFSLRNNSVDGLHFIVNKHNNVWNQWEKNNDVHEFSVT